MTMLTDEQIAARKALARANYRARNPLKRRKFKYKLKDRGAPKFKATMTDEQIAAHNERARESAARRARGPRVQTEREQVLHILFCRAHEPGLTQDEFLARWRRYKQVMEATRPTAERSAARS